MKFIKLDEPLFNITAWLFIGDQLSLQRKLRRRNIDIDIIRHLDGMHFEIRKDRWVVNVIWLENEHKLSHLIHEVVHLSIEALNVRGIPINFENQEILAYLISYFAREFRNKMD